ncbi:cytochrome c oxidase assembly protein [Micromonospora sp. NPDC050397]|uniref:cytochrome c oxidase assembly protein n=1 Tax=Micromonospora sp. NPDC050397 TaxID=3364279 RepID=UPI00384B2DCC
MVLLLALRLGGGLESTAIVGLPDPGALTRWALPVVRVLLDGLATVTVGLLVTSAFLLPGDGGSVSPRGYLLLRRVTWCAFGWALASLAMLVLTVSDLLGQPVERLPLATVWSFTTSISQGRALALQAGLALLLAVLSRAGVSRTLAATTAVLGLVAVLPPAFTGHAAGAGNHQLATTSLALHVLAATVWVGGLVGLLLLRRSRLLADAAARYSRLALACFVLVAASGLANAWVRLGEWDQLWRSDYGLLLLGKIAALLLLGGLGAVHRARTLPALRAGSASPIGPALPAGSASPVGSTRVSSGSAGSRWGFVRLAAGEVVLFAATFGLAVALSRSPTPVPVDPVEADPLVDLLGFGMPAAPSAARMLGDVLPDMFFLTVTTFGIAAYLTGVWRLRRAGHRWPWSRTANWVAGMLLLAAITNLGVARYAYVLFSAHMVQHMVLSMAVPILLVGGAPVTLALRALRRPADPNVRGAREWLLLLVHSRVLRTFTHPLIALGLYVASLYGLYFSGLLGTLMRYHLGHLAMLVHFVLVGYLLFWVLIGIDPGRRRLPRPLLVVVHFAAMIFHAFLGVILMQSTTVIAPDWYTAVHPDWAGTLLADQHLGAGIAWAFGEVPAAIVMILLVRQWIRADEREQARLDRAADRAQASGEEDELARYNAFLAEAARRDGR